MKKWCILMLGVLGFPCTWAATFPLQIEQSAAVYRTTVDPSVYASSRMNGLADLVIHNASGDAVPYALVPFERFYEQDNGPIQFISVPVYPVKPNKNATVATTHIQLDQPQHRTQIHLHSEDTPLQPNYWFDLGKNHLPVVSLQLDWEGPANSVMNLDIYGSDNLKDWFYAGEGVVMRLLPTQDAGVKPIVKNMLTFNRGLTARYAQVRFREAYTGLKLTAMRVAYHSKVSLISQLFWHPMDAMKRRVESENVVIEFESNGRYPVSHIDVSLPEQNTITQAHLQVRNQSNAPWRNIALLSLYNISQNGKIFTHDPMEISPVVARYWRLVFPKQFGGIGRESPSLKLGWLPDVLVWNARGNAPFTLNVGHEEPLVNQVPLTQMTRLLPDQPLASLPEAKLAQKMQSEAADSVWETATFDWRYWLWGGLLLGVFSLVWMLRTLFKEGRKE